METGIQVSSLRPYLTTAEEVREAFGRIAGLSVRTVQLQWIDKKVAAEDIAAALHKYNLRSVSVQDFYTEFCADKEYYMDLCRKTGSKDLTLSRIPEEWRNPAGIERMAESLAKIAEELEAEGMTLSFHPTAPDYRAVDYEAAEDTLLERLLSKVPQMNICLDLYHCNKAGRSMAEMLERYAGRVTMVHFKEGKVLPDGSEVLVPAGQGDIDWTGVKNACLSTGVTYAFAEQEKWDRDPYICLKEALSFIQLLR